MLKMAKKSLLVVALLLCIAGGSLAAYAAFTVTSNVAGPVTINYVITLDASGYPTLTATITNSGGYPVPNGSTVYFWYYAAPTGTVSGTPVFDSTTWVNFDTQITSGGVASTIFSPPTNGYDYWFAATYSVP